MDPERDVLRELNVLAESARRVPFFALVRHLTRLLPRGAAVGGLGPVSDETVLFRHDIRPVFHASDVVGARVVLRDGRYRVEVTTGFLGVVGSVSPLANYFTEEVLRSESLDETALRSFYDLFHHRLIAFVYGAHLRAAPSWEVRADGADRVTRRSLALAGVTRAAEGTMSLTAFQWGGFARIVGRRPRGRDALEAALALAFPGVPIRLMDFLRRDLELSERERAQLARQSVTLGRGARLGSRLLAQTGLVRVVIGPLDRPTFDAFLPGGARHARLSAVVDSVTAGMLDADVELHVALGEEPRARLGRRFGTRLGVFAIVARPRDAQPLRVTVPLTGDAGAARPAAAQAPLV